MNCGPDRNIRCDQDDTKLLERLLNNTEHGTIRNADNILDTLADIRHPGLLITHNKVTGPRQGKVSCSKLRRLCQMVARHYALAETRH